MLIKRLFTSPKPSDTLSAQHTKHTYNKQASDYPHHLNNIEPASASSYRSCISPNPVTFEKNVSYFVTLPIFSKLI